jgi:hypothetical protein
MGFISNTKKLMSNGHGAKKQSAKPTNWNWKLYTHQLRA